MKKQLFLILLTLSVIAKAQNKTDYKETESQKRMTELSEKKRHRDRKSTRLNSSHKPISYAVFCLKKKKKDKKKINNY